MLMKLDLSHLILTINFEKEKNLITLLWTRNLNKEAKVTYFWYGFRHSIVTQSSNLKKGINVVLGIEIYGIFISPKYIFQVVVITSKQKLGLHEVWQMSQFQRNSWEVKAIVPLRKTIFFSLNKKCEIFKIVT